MNEVQRLTQQVQQLQLILEDMQQTLMQLASHPSYGSQHAVEESVNARLSAALSEPAVPRQSEFAAYARRPYGSQ